MDADLLLLLVSLSLLSFLSLPVHLCICNQLFYSILNVSNPHTSLFTAFSLSSQVEPKMNKGPQTRSSALSRNSHPCYPGFIQFFFQEIYLLTKKGDTQIQIIQYSSWTIVFESMNGGYIRYWISLIIYKYWHACIENVFKYSDILPFYCWLLLFQYNTL